MKVTDVNVNFVRDAYVREANKFPEKKIDSDKAGAGAVVAVPKDEVSLSGSSRDINLAIEAAEAALDERTEKVSRLKDAVENGSYRVNAQAIAGKLIGGSVSEII